MDTNLLASATLNAHSESHTNVRSSRQWVHLLVEHRLNSFISPLTPYRSNTYQVLGNTSSYNALSTSGHYKFTCSARSHLQVATPSLFKQSHAKQAREGLETAGWEGGRGPARSIQLVGGPVSAHLLGE